MRKKAMQKRIQIRDLQSMATGEGEEIRFSIVQVGSQRRLTMSPWVKGMTWHRMAGHIEIPLELLPVLSARLRAAVVKSPDDVAA